MRGISKLDKFRKLNKGAVSKEREEEKKEVPLSQMESEKKTPLKELSIPFFHEESMTLFKFQSMKQEKLFEEYDYSSIKKIVPDFSFLLFSRDDFDYFITPKKAKISLQSSNSIVPFLESLLENEESHLPMEAIAYFAVKACVLYFQGEVQSV